MRFINYGVPVLALGLAGMIAKPADRMSQLAFEPGQLRGTCERCTNCGGDWDKMETRPDPVGISEGQPCVPDVCHGMGSCIVIETDEDAAVPEEQLDADAVAELWNAMLRQDSRELTQLLLRHPRYLSLNIERHAIQLRSCATDYIIGSVPLPAATVAAIQKSLTDRYAEED